MAAIVELSKKDELARLDAFVADQSEVSYLRAILGNLRPAIATAIANDFCVVDWNPHALDRQYNELNQKIAAAHSELKSVMARKQQAEHDLDGLVRRADEAAEALDTLAHKCRRIGK